MLIPCEKKYAEELLKTGFRRFLSKRDLSILARYSKYLGKNKKQTRDDLVKFCIKFSEDYNYVLFYDRIAEAVNNSEKYQLRVFSPIGITQNEINAIRTIPDFRKQKALFIMLVLGKMFAREDIEKTYVNFSFSEILRLAKISVNKAEKDKMGQDLVDTELVDINGNAKFEVSFIDKDQNDFIIIVTDENNIISFLQFQCPKCGKEMQLKSKRSRKMCDECYKKYNNVEKHH
jgi:5-methylthioribose kinase